MDRKCSRTLPNQFSNARVKQNFKKAPEKINYEIKIAHKNQNKKMKKLF